MKFVYVLISDSKDYYTEQCFLSIISLRKYNEDAEVILLTDVDTYKCLGNKRVDLLGCVNEIITYDFSDKYDNRARSKKLKTLSRRLLRGDYIYIDCDTIICSQLEVGSDMYSISAVKDNHSCIDSSIAEFSGVVERAKKCKASAGYGCIHYNSGVIICRDNDNCYAFFKKWEELWELHWRRDGISIDQLSFNEANSVMEGPIHEIDGTWNCQLRYGMRYVADAKILHYLASSSQKAKINRSGYFFAQTTLYEELRKNGIITDDMMECIEKPRSAFGLVELMEVGSDNYLLTHSKVGALLRFLIREHYAVFNLINRVLTIFDI